MAKQRFWESWFLHFINYYYYYYETSKISIFLRNSFSLEIFVKLSDWTNTLHMMISRCREKIMNKAISIFFILRTGFYFLSVPLLIPISFLFQKWTNELVRSLEALRPALNGRHPRRRQRCRWANAIWIPNGKRKTIACMLFVPNIMACQCLSKPISKIRCTSKLWKQIRT